MFIVNSKGLRISNKLYYFRHCTGEEIRDTCILVRGYRLLNSAVVYKYNTAIIDETVDHPPSRVPNYKIIIIKVRNLF